MPGRDDFDPDYFTDNPMEGKDPLEVYEELQWGNKPNDAWSIEAPESMATLGDLARLDIDNETVLQLGEDDAPFLAIGVDSNSIYVVKKDEEGEPIDIPKDGYEVIGNATRVDYFSDKGGEEAYYYHEHEAPFPKVLYHKDGVIKIVPANDDGKRSFAVAEEGIIG